MKTNVQQIKISTSDKGYFHWERYLKIKTKRRITKLLFELDINPWKKRLILDIYHNNITNENIIPISNHDAETILYYLIKDQLAVLIKNTIINKL